MNRAASISFELRDLKGLFAAIRDGQALLVSASDPDWPLGGLPCLDDSVLPLGNVLDIGESWAYFWFLASTSALSCC